MTDNHLSEALISFSLASVALSRGRQDDFERQSNKAIESMVASGKNMGVWIAFPYPSASMGLDLTA